MFFPGLCDALGVRLAALMTGAYGR